MEYLSEHWYLVAYLALATFSFWCLIRARNEVGEELWDYLSPRTYSDPAPLSWFYFIGVTVLMFIMSPVFLPVVLSTNSRRHK